MSDKIEISRRKFLKGSMTGLAAVSVPAWLSKSAQASIDDNPRAQTQRVRGRRIGPNDTIQLGIIGAGGSRGGFRMGLALGRHASSVEGCKVVAVSDVDEVHLQEACNAFGEDCKGYKDFRDLLSRRDIDAVLIGTPDHWHAYQCIAAMNAGKDVYCEKPLTLTVDEGRKIVNAWKRTGRVFQTGSQQRSVGHFRQACELVYNGRIGRIKRVEARLPTGPTGGPFESKPVPADFDWDMWLGPAYYTDYVFERTHGNFRWWLEYSGGMLTDWGAHHLDITQWALGMDNSGPLRVEATGVAPDPHRNAYNTFPEFDVTYIYPGGITVLATNKGENGIQFKGEEGEIFVSRGGIRASEQRIIDDPLPSDAKRLYASDHHMRDFLDCMRSRKQPICDAEVGHRSVTVCHLANISLRLGGRRLDWDPAKEEFVNDPEANTYLSKPARKPWAI